MDFLVPEELKLAGIVTHLTDLHKDSLMSGSYEVKTLRTSLLHEILDELQAPRFFEYFSLDIEGSEYEVLRSFPFNKYRSVVYR